MSELLISKQESIERCVKRARSTWGNPSALPFEDDYDKQDIVVLNLQRACELTLDMANHIIRKKKLGWPKGSAESVTLLRKAGHIPAALEKKLIGMIGFGNIVTHQYRDIDYQLVENIVKKDAADLIEFAALLVALPE